MSLTKRLMKTRKFGLIVAVLCVMAVLSGCITTNQYFSITFSASDTLSENETIVARLNDGGVLYSTGPRQEGQLTFEFENPDRKTIVGAYIHDSTTGVSWVPQYGFSFNTIPIINNVVVSDESKTRDKPKFPAVFAELEGKPEAHTTEDGFVNVTFSVYDDNYNLVGGRTEIFIMSSELVTFYDNTGDNAAQDQPNQADTGISYYTQDGKVTFTLKADLIDPDEPNLSAIPIALFSGPNRLSLSGIQAPLTALELSSGSLSPDFDPSITAYTANVTHDVSSISVTASTYSHAAISVNQVPVDSGQASESIGLNAGANSIEVAVSLPYGDTQLYTINVHRAARPHSNDVIAPPVVNTALTSSTGSLTLPVGRSGELSLGEAIILKVPAGAAEQELKLLIEEVSERQGLLSSNETLLSSIFEVTKNVPGLFNKPVTITLLFDPALLEAHQKAVISYYDEEKKQWVEIGGEVSGNAITVEVDHFTKFAVFAANLYELPLPVLEFSDLSGHWAEDVIREAASKGIVAGFEDGSFRPDVSISRAQFAVILMNALQAPAPATKLAFTDSNVIGAWAKTAVAQAVEAGIVTGYVDGSFRPNELISRAEMAVMLAKALGLPIQADQSTTFADDTNIPAWARSAVAELQRLELVQGKGANSFQAHASATRAEAVKIILNTITYKESLQ